MNTTLAIDENEPLTVDADRLRFDLNAAVQIVAERRIGLERRRKEFLGDSPKIDAAALAKRRIGLQKLADESLLLDEAENSDPGTHHRGVAGDTEQGAARALRRGDCSA